MMKKRTFFLLTLLLGILGNMPAQSISRYYDFLDGNKVRARLNNGSDHFWNLLGSPSYEVPAGSDKHSVFAKSIWIGGVDQNSQLHVAANTYRQTGQDFYSGPYRSSGIYDMARGFFAPSAVKARGLIGLSSGKVLTIYPSGFTVYDPATGTILNRILPQARVHFDAVEMPDGRILLYGDDNFPTISDALVIDSTNFNATVWGQLNYPHRLSSATVLGNGKVLIAGIMGSEIVDPQTNAATAINANGQARVNNSTALLPNGKVMVFGGGSTLFGAGSTAATQLYDPVTNTWAAGPSMNVARGAAEVTLLPSGSYLVTGGSTTLSDFEVYDPIANTFTPMAGVGFPINAHSATALANGEVLLSTKENGVYAEALLRYDPVTQSFTDLPLAIKGFQAVNLPGGSIMAQFDGFEFREIDALSGSILGQRWQKIWKVSRSAVDQFQQDWQANQVNFANYPDIETWPAHGDTAAGEDAYLAPFVDVNMDGRYRPLQDGDYPCFEGQLGMWWVYHDNGPHFETNGQELGIQVESMAYTYDCATTACPDSFLDYTTFYHHEITNKSANNYSDVYIGIWVDTDIGYFGDDYVGADSALGLGFAYNGNNNDNPQQGGYGQAPPALGTVLLQESGNVGTATNFMFYQNDFSTVGNPEQPVHYYNYMRSVWKDGSPLVNDGGDGYSSTAGLPPVKLMFPGDPGFCGGAGTGWTEISAGNQPFDRRFIQSIGPLTLAAGQTLKVDQAMIWARGSDNLNSVCRLKTATSAIRNWWENQSHGCFNIVLAQEVPAEISKSGVRLFPNPSSGEFSLELDEALTAEGTLSIFDMQGRKLHGQAVAPRTKTIAVQPTLLPTGMYLVELTVKGSSITKKLIVGQ